MSDFLVYNLTLAISKKKQLVMLLEVKKQILSDICLINHSNIIEMLLCQIFNFFELSECSHLY